MDPLAIRGLRVLNGVTISALSGEGISPSSDLHLWADRGRIPASADGAGFATRFADDIGLLAESGVGALRYGLDWARIEPQPGQFDGQAIEHVSRVVETARSAGVQLWLGLQHDTVPGWFLDEGGFADDRFRSRVWPRYVDLMAEAFGDSVAGWFPLHDPTGFIAGGYRRGTRPPGRKDPEAAAKALRGVWLAWRDAWRLLRGGPPVATSVWLPEVHAVDHTVQASKRTKGIDDRTWRASIAALRDGELDIPGLAVEEVPDLADSFDIVGFVWRGALTVRGLVEPDESLHSPYPADSRVDAVGNAPWNEGLANVLHRLHEELPGRAVMLAGASVDTDDESWRTEVVDGVRTVCDEAVSDGIDVRGRFWWSFVDGYDHRSGFAPRTGLFDRDRNARPALETWTR